MRRYPFALIFVAALLLPACGVGPSPDSFEPERIPVTSSGGSVGPRFSSGPNAELMLSWMERGNDSATLRYANYLNGAWAAPETVTVIPDMFVNWADLPAVLPLGNGRLAAHWLQKSGAGTYAYDVVFTQSFDSGRTWLEPIRPHSDGTETEHGFVSLYPRGSSIGLVWLDGRNMADDNAGDPLSAGMTLRAATVADDQTVSDEQLIDELICDCCQTDIALAASGPVAVYRDRSVEEIRDILVTRFVDGRWQPGKPIAGDNWHIAACPVNGPSIAARGSHVAVAWFTAADGPLVRVALSQDDGQTFSAPVDIVGTTTLGRVAVVILNDGDVAVSWLQPSNGGNQINVRRVLEDGALGPMQAVANGAAPLAVPQMALVGDDLVFAWTEQADDGGRIAAARIPADAL